MYKTCVGSLDIWPYVTHEELRTPLPWPMSSEPHRNYEENNSVRVADASPWANQPSSGAEKSYSCIGCTDSFEHPSLLAQHILDYAGKKCVSP